MGRNSPVKKSVLKIVTHIGKSENPTDDRVAAGRRCSA